MSWFFKLILGVLKNFMRFIASVTILIIFLGFSPLISSAGELALFKESITEEGTRHLVMGGCGGIFYVKQGKNVPDMRDFQDYSCEGDYSLTLEGLPNTMVTLYGNFFHITDRGYLVLRKTDERKVWIIYPGSFKPGAWLHVDPEDKRYGSYDIYYHEGWHFERYISSVKWGKWWMGEDLPSLSKK